MEDLRKEEKGREEMVPKALDLNPLVSRIDLHNLRKKEQKKLNINIT